MLSLQTYSQRCQLINARRKSEEDFSDDCLQLKPMNAMAESMRRQLQI
jgi:hypothetical protein